MNTIKFRIWNPEEKKMIESGATPMMLHSFFEYSARFNTQYEMPYQQLTGLTDKLGKEIYEGDIIRYTFWQNSPQIGSVIVPVYFCEGGFVVATTNGEPLTLREAIKISNEASGLEIIGNTYENPDLLNNFKKI